MNYINRAKIYRDISDTVKSSLKYFVKVYLPSAFIFFTTFVVIFLIYTAIVNINKDIEKKSALKYIPDKKVRELNMVSESFDYDRTVQTWVMPKYTKWLSPISWLKYTENCIFSGRLNAMKYAGMIPGNWSIGDFIKAVNDESLIRKWALHSSRHPLTDKKLDEINHRINGRNNYKYKWVSIKSMDELIYLAKRGHHVFVYTQVWLGPSKNYPKPVLYRSMKFAHACTITGIKSYDPVQDVIEFEIHETLPFSELTLTPVYSKRAKNRVNLFDRQSLPYIIRNRNYARSGYIVRVKNK